MNKQKKNIGITLIALIITIIVLLILAGVTLNMVLGENGLFNKAQEANQTYNKTEALEKMQFKVAEIQMKYYSEEHRKATLQEITDCLTGDENVEYIKLGKEISSIDVTGYSSIIVKLNAYVYDFEITDNGEVFILGEYSSEKIKITFDANGGAIASNNKWEGSGQVVTKSLYNYFTYGEMPIPARDEYIFLGWSRIKSTEENQEIEYITSTSNVMTKEDHTLYAIWEPYKKRFDYRGAEEQYIIKKTGYYKIEAYGAGGGRNRINNYYLNDEAPGGYASGIIELNEGEKLYFYVGKKGADGIITKGIKTSSSFNGGGAGIGSSDANDGGGAGGGATDVRLVSGDWNSFNSLKSRILVAGGGSGGGTIAYEFSKISGGLGGGITGTGSVWNWENIELKNHTYNATQTAGYKFGIGEDGLSYNNSGGAGAGGGYYGGLSSRESYAGGAGGGSGFVSGFEGCNAISEYSTEDNIVHTGKSIHYSGKFFINPQLTTSNNKGDGYAIIEYIGENY